MTEQQTERRYMREPSRRVFASELREVRLDFREGTDEKSPTYVMFPTGIRCNRIFVCGEMILKEQKGEDNIFYSVRVKDPTGMFFVNAGSYQPDAMQQISRIEQGSFVAVVGKPVIRKNDDGSAFVSVRAESVFPVDRDTYRIWVDDTAEQTLDRLDEFGTTPDSEKAAQFYNTDPEKYRQIVGGALREIEF
ncbi:nucleic acid-binding protein [Methanomicrobiaceae archaeon CYW5]|uniref:nucleic acid-binding protein n=1 Tax=Methanovulcanius yangii TaxID=1789227 RepID=UPI0029CA9E66|nr:nucleic acid-binding protein [Methanovulcanius yangii]MBT8508860.1 nucleic acid-binding protein [Methanovulcanius yangii]